MKHLKRFNESNNTTKTLDDILMFCKKEIIRINSGRVRNGDEPVLNAFKSVIKESGVKVFSDEYLRVEKILSDLMIDSYIINDDYSVDINDNVIFSKSVDNFPIKFGRVSGSFDCSGCKLKTLEGSPYYVGGNFDCSDNNLKDLKGSPGEVGNDFYCSRNKLISLEGMSPEINGSFNCMSNPNLKELDSVSNIEGEIYCDSHIDITKFAGECYGIMINDSEQQNMLPQF